MSLILPVNVDDLLRARGVESARIEFKAAWDGARVGPQVLKTVCAFANDLHNLNGGYVVIGVEEDQGVARFPLAGLPREQLDAAQKWLRGQCNRMDPVYQPILSPEVVDGRALLVVWAPASDVRPHASPGPERDGDGRHHYVRIGSESVKAQGEILTQLLEQTARVPFDDRRSLVAPLHALRESRVREFLNDLRSGLQAERDVAEIWRRLRVSSPANGHEAPRNVGLMFFTDDPDDWFRGARIEVVQYAGGAAGDVLEERVFRGPLHVQLREAIAHLRALGAQHVQKVGDRAEARGWTSYPLPALEESLVNAVYHRGYEGPPEPIKVHLFPDRVEIVSYPGPVRGIERAHLRAGGRVPPTPARNRRIGELLKELRLAGRGTGLPRVFRAMEENGSPPPTFDFDEDRTYFRVTLPAHPEYRAIAALRDAAHLRAVGDDAGALARLSAAHAQDPASAVLAGAVIEQHLRLGEPAAARTTFDRLVRSLGGAHPAVARAARQLAQAYLDADLRDDALGVLDLVRPALASAESIELAVVERRAGREDRAHAHFATAGDTVQTDARALHEFAQCKLKLAEGLNRQRRRSQADEHARLRLLRDARDMLQRVTQLDAPAARHAWAWSDVAEALRRLRAPRQEVVGALEQAVRLQPHEARFQRKLSEAKRA